MNDMATSSIVGSQCMASQPMASQSTTNAARQASVLSQSDLARSKATVHPPVTVTAEEFAKVTGTVVVHPPVTVTTEEFEKGNGYIVAEALPVTVGIDTVGVETNREVVVK